RREPAGPEAARGRCPPPRARFHSVAWQLPHPPRRQSGRDLQAAAAPERDRAAGGRLRAARAPARHRRHAAGKRQVPRRARRQPEGMKLAVIGVGLIGGSFALALKQAKVASHVVGVGRNPANLKLALERGAIDSIAADPAAAARGADLVLLATPVSHYPKILSSMSLHSTLVVTDAGSTIRDFTRIASSHPEMWRDICIANRDRLLEEIDRYSKNLGSIRSIVEAADAAALEKLLSEARTARQRWLDGEFES